MELIVIQKRIYEVRGYKVMLDFDLAELYGTETKRLNEQVKRNLSRFPRDFMFRLTAKEWRPMRSQIATASQTKRNINIRPYVFTEHGVSMLASILKTKRAVKMNIAIVRAFISLRQFAMNYKELARQISDIRETVSGHSQQLNQIYDAIENMLTDKSEQKAWKGRERIGFKK